MSEPIRVLHVLTRMDYGGTETLLMRLYRSMDRDKVQFDFAVTSETEAPYDAEIIRMGGEIYHYPRYKIKNHFEYCKWWNDFLKEHRQQYDIVHGHIGSTASIYLNIAKKYGCFTIAHSHSTRGPIKSTKAILYQMYSYPTRFIADAFFGCSYQALEERYGKRVAKDSSRAWVLNNGIEAKKYCYDESIRNKVRQELGVKSEFLVGHVGRITAAKNPVFLIKIFAEIIKKKTDARLLYVGKGELQKKVQQEVAQLNISDKVIFVEQTNCVERYLNAMDVFVFPSLWEGLGIAVIEAQAAGLPVMASNCLPKETNVTELIQYISLKESEDVWANIILNYNYEKRENMYSQIKKSGFDIEQTAQWLQNFYLKIAYRQK